ncbi:two-partner secretion domain-containing protein [Proteus vulgaris]|uniref:two-partner secretion domain-containing protein n=1 Tax=Proteus vulgaris TaxID=585 RepID=UPI0034D46469
MMKKLNLFAKPRYGLLILCLSTNVYSSDNGIVVDTHKYKDLEVVKTKEGIETVFIEKPDENGFSFNYFTSFNVNNAGAIIDNRSAEANIIINEVTSQETSKLNGDLSVLGKASALIIANPNGIECNQCQFSGVNNVSLVTGVNDINNKDHYNMSDKEIIINGMGETPKKQTINIVSNNIKIIDDYDIDYLNVIGGYSKVVFGDYLWDGLNYRNGLITIERKNYFGSDNIEYSIDKGLKLIYSGMIANKKINNYYELNFIKVNKDNDLIYSAYSKFKNQGVSTKEMLAYTHALNSKEYQVQ